MATPGLAGVPRMRVFAGPNGSGKSTVLGVIRPEWVGVYVNADDMERTLRQTGALALDEFGLSADAEALALEFREHLRDSGLLRKHGLHTIAERFQIRHTALELPEDAVNSYVAAVLADAIRRALVARRISFTFETVMSSPDKIDFMQTAQGSGYRNYLYFVATDDPSINVERVALRVSQGGHTVPTDRIIERYARSLALLDAACQTTNRAYVFDNSGSEHRLIAEVTNGDAMTLHVDTLPDWFTNTSLWEAYLP